MKNIFIALIIIMLSPGLYSQEEVTIPLSSPGDAARLDINIRNGNIVIKGSNRNDVMIKYSVEKPEDDEKNENDERKGLKKISTNNYDFGIEENNNTVSITSQSWFVHMDVEIEVPKNMDMEVENYMGGIISVDNISGELTIESYTGGITATNISGIVNASTYTGDIEISYSDIKPDSPMSFSNYTGAIDLTMPGSYQADLKMKTNWGEVFSDLDIVTKPTKPELKKEEDGKSYKLYTDSYTYATLNGGGPEILIKTQMGNIYLRKK